MLSGWAARIFEGQIFQGINPQTPMFPVLVQYIGKWKRTQEVMSVS